MLNLHLMVYSFSSLLVFQFCNLVRAQDYPAKPIRFIAQNPGGSGDFAARLVAPVIAKSLGQPIVVENRALTVAIETAAKSPPDGYTLLIAGTSLWVSPLMVKNLPYDAIRDFSPITMMTQVPTLVVVHPSLPVKSIKELVALAKAKPGALNFATGGPGTELDGLLFNALAGVNTVAVAYRGNGPALNAVISGEAQLMYVNATNALPQVKSGRVRALAVASMEPSELVPGLPTVASVVPGYEVVTATMAFAPAKTPATIINRLHQEIVRALNQKEIKEKFLSAGVEPFGGSPEQLDATMKSQIAKLSKVIKEAGIGPQ